MPPSIFTYIDYRQFLTDVFGALKAGNPRFSLRRFARMAESSSPNFLQLIQSRVLNIGPRGIDALARSLGMNKEAQRYFEAITAFDHARTHEDKDHFFREILALRQPAEVTHLQKNQYEYFSHWYIPVIRELAVCAEYPGDPAWIADRITPRISVSKARNGIALLEKLGLISRDSGSQRLVQADRAVSTPSEVLSVAVTRYHRDMIALGREAIDRFDASVRDIRAVTLGISKEGYAEVKLRCEAFWKELLAFSAAQTNTDEVYQMNMQLFPLTRRIRKRRRA